MAALSWIELVSLLATPVATVDEIAMALAADDIDALATMPVATIEEVLSWS